METKDEWGPRHWHRLHMTAIHYPIQPTEKERETTFKTFWSFIQQLPCPECRQHTIAYLRNHPLNLTNSQQFQTWAWQFHNAVNKRLSKPIMTADEYNSTYREEHNSKYWNLV